MEVLARMGEFDFFTPAPLMLAGPGFSLFGPEHIAWLIYAAALVIVLIVIYRRLPEGIELGSRRRTAMLVVAGVPLVLLVSQDVLMARAGVFSAAWWPLHSCNVCEYLALVYAIRPNRFCGEVLFTLGTVGAIAALLFPGWTYCPPLTWPVVCGFTEHALIMAFILMIVVGGDFRPHLRDIWMTILFTAAYAFFAYWFNTAFGTNFMFVNTPSEGSPLVLWEQMFGYPGYLVPYAALVLVIWVDLHLIATLVRKVTNRGL